MKRFRDIQGNDAVVTALRQMVDGGKIPHALLLHENDGGGAFPIVLAFLQYSSSPSPARTNRFPASSFPLSGSWRCSSPIFMRTNSSAPSGWTGSRC